MKNKRGISYITMILGVLIVMVIGTGILVIISKGMPEQVIETNAYINTEKYMKRIDGVDFVDYFIKDLKAYVESNVILKDSQGFIESDRLTLTEYYSNLNRYRNDLFAISTNKDVVKYAYEKNGKTYIVYDFNKVLNILDLSYLPNDIFANIDSEGCRLYCVEDKGLITDTKKKSQSRNAIIVSYGFASQLLLDAIMNQLDYSIESGKLINIETRKVYTYEEYKVDKAKFYSYINENLGNEQYINNFRFTELGLECNYNLRKILKDLGYEIEDFSGLDYRGVGAYIYK